MLLQPSRFPPPSTGQVLLSAANTLGFAALAAGAVARLLQRRPPHVLLEAAVGRRASALWRACWFLLRPALVLGLFIGIGLASEVSPPLHGLGLSVCLLVATFGLKARWLLFGFLLVRF